MKRRIVTIVAGLSLCAAADPVSATGLRSLHSFDGEDGRNPSAGLVEGGDGNFYGTTSEGGTSTNCDFGCGTLFRISPEGQFTSLHSFDGGDGVSPRSTFVRGNEGEFYGVTSGGANSRGTIFRVDTLGSLTNLYSFSGAEGAFPAGLTMGADGKLYGMTAAGGASTNCAGVGCGAVFRFDPIGGLTILHSFDRSDGSSPNGRLVLGSDGNFYGTTVEGGENGWGTVFRISPEGSFNLLYSFTGFEDSAFPYAGLVEGDDGNFYGATYGAFDQGEIFRITPGGSLTILHSFQDGTDGARPVAGLVKGRDGNLYGTASGGGSPDSQNFTGYGTVFRVRTNGVLTAVYQFSALSGRAGQNPSAELVQGSDGDLYGTTTAGGTGGCSIIGCGTVFRLSLGPCPDLTGTWTSLAQACKTKTDGPHCKVKGKLLVRNVGTADAPTSLIRYYLSSDGIQTNTFLKQQATGTVKPGKPKKKVLSAELPVGVNGSSQFIIAVIDAGHTVTECDEGNNDTVFGPLH